MKTNKLIGLSGYPRCGKDTVANYLRARWGYTAVSFADPMRTIASIFQGDVQAWRDGDESDYRTKMQSLGAYGRNHIDHDIWVKAAMRRVQPGGLYVMPDVRYLNEVQAIVNSGGRIIWVERPGFGKVNNHESESNYGYIRDRADDIILNSGSLQDLYAAVRRRVQWTAADGGQDPLLGDCGC